MFKFFIIILIASALFSGCAELPIKDGALVIDKDTSAGMEDMGVGSLTRKF
jgi:hypothetical protein